MHTITTQKYLLFVVTLLKPNITKLHGLSPQANYTALGFTQSLTEISTRNIKIMFLGSKVRRVRKAHKLTAIYEPFV
jgi:hypothetical protein